MRESIHQPAADRRLARLSACAVFACLGLVFACGADATDSSGATAETKTEPAATQTTSTAPIAAAEESAPVAARFIEVDLGGTTHRFTEFGARDATWTPSQLGGLLSIEGKDADGASFRIMTSNIDLSALDLPASLQAEDMKQFEERLGHQPEPTEVTKLRMIGLQFRDGSGGKFSNGLPKPTLTIEEFDGHRVRGSFSGILHGRKQGDLEMTNGRFDVTLASDS